MSLLQDVAWASKYAGGHVPVMELIRLKIKDGKYYIGMNSAEASFLAQGGTELSEIDVCVDAKQFAKITNIKSLSLKEKTLVVNTGASKISFVTSPPSDIQWPKMPDLDYPSFEVTPDILSTLKELANFADPTNQGMFGAVWMTGNDIIAFTDKYCAYRKNEVSKDMSIPVGIIKELRQGSVCYSTDRGMKVVYDDNHKITFNTTDRGNKAPNNPIKFLEEFVGSISVNMTSDLISSFLECMAIVNPIDAKGHAPVRVHDGKMYAHNMTGQDFEIDIVISGEQPEPYYVNGKYLALALSGYKDGCTLEMNKVATLVSNGAKNNTISNISYA